MAKAVLQVTLVLDSGDADYLLEQYPDMTPEEKKEFANNLKVELEEVTGFNCQSYEMVVADADREITIRR